MTLKNRSAYRRLMDAVVVTPELEERVLEAVARRAERRPVIPAARRRILTACAAAACCVVLVVAQPFYGGPAVTATPPAAVQGGYGSVEYDSPQALAEALSWPLAIPTALPEGYSLLLAQSLPGELAELRWSDGADTLRYRMAPGSEDISGDYTQYSEISTRVVGTRSVQCRGEGGMIYTAVWTADGYSCSLSASGGLSPAELEGILSSIQSIEKGK